MHFGKDFIIVQNIKKRIYLSNNLHKKRKINYTSLSLAMYQPKVLLELEVTNVNFRRIVNVDLELIS